ncbi:hypothetical protein ASPWEDRAFT_103441 [Aspergillus wentii DTO 134E9]|uniref:HpcH/HpaI aldolase/citrate lyase domain-containing protein n=1 Tax=Aspergillus wentii DTO 134E9 TaxID=1073089 RepID=A0A1L9RTP6_ASPWE|nr:uncharacterized protein ASPWEDRAFT_103441 [Aspergillus wentii DTO 134E9]OJJ38302.1 hypothetical protein ASPWEDRAFT_103441 [Aspergillus wentii DTO 134E9]
MKHSLPSAALAKTILRESFFSWVLIDAEHGLITDRYYYELCNAIASSNSSPIIRVPAAEEWMIKRTLDAGAHGIVVPMCHSVTAALNTVKYIKYPPLGIRGYGPMFASHAFPGSNYDEDSQCGVSVIVQIESRAGVENVEEIAAVDGVDVLFVGPFDLAKQMGVQRGGEEHEAAIRRVVEAARGAGKKVAIFCTDGEDARKRVQQGFDMVSVATDVGVVKSGMLNELKRARE